MPTHADPVSTVIFWVTLVFVFGVIGRYIAHRFDQPGVLGELLMGVLVGNLCYFAGMPIAVILREGSSVFSIFKDLLAGLPLVDAVRSALPDASYSTGLVKALEGPDGFDLIKVAYVLDIFSRYGVIFLLFMVGLESSVEEIKTTGRASLQVALIGMAAPIALGLLVTIFLLPEAPFNTDLFVAATLAATSVGITARVLKEMNKLKTTEAKTILGAAMIDDVLGLVMLAIVSGMVIHGFVDFGMIFHIILYVVLFFAGVLTLGPWALRKAVLFFKFLDPWESKLVVSFICVMTLSWLATCVQLASIIGAFAAGLILHDGFFKEASDKRQIREIVGPLEALMAPLFFMLIGIQVKLETFYNWHVLLIASGLIVSAVVGKLVSGLGARAKDDRLLIGVGMLPRGEVGLVFASIGRTLGVISDELFSSIILMVIVTTFMAPPWLKARFKRHTA